MMLSKVPIVEGVTPQTISKQIVEDQKPVVLKGLVDNWPLVLKGKESSESLVDYLTSFYEGRPTIVCKTAPEHRGRLFYQDGYRRLNFESFKGRIDETLNLILNGVADEAAPCYYIASNLLSSYLPGLRRENDLVLPRSQQPDSPEETVSIWIGGASTASCHFDALENIACCVKGTRRFTLFPPDQISNLYPGPLEPTPGGQVISLVDFENPDFSKFPRFKQALLHAQVAELEPGDALYIPTMWWHHVEAMTPFNILINFWWDDSPGYLTSGMNSLLLAMLGIRDKSAAERRAWKHFFDYYIFGGNEIAAEILPEGSRGFLGALDDLNARKLRAKLINKLNR